MHAWPQVDRAALRADRFQRTAAIMRRLDLDHLLLTSFDDIRFVTDYRTLIVAEGFDWFAAIVDRQGESEIFVPWVDEPVRSPDPDLPHVTVLQPLPSWTPVHPHLAFWVTALSRTLAARSARRVGFELVYAELLGSLQQELPEIEFVPVTNELHEIRLEKHAIEMQLLSAASDVNSTAAAAAMDAAKPGMNDHEILAVAMEALQRSGVEYLSHSLCNVRRGTGTWFAVGNELREGDAYFFDIGCYGHGGYSSDMARTGFVGEPPKPVRDVHARLLEALRTGEEASRPGARASDVHAAINGYLERQGLPLTPYSSGHGVGLRICELPTIHRSDRISRDLTLTEGMVISLEPETGVEVDGRFVLLKVEDNYIVEGDGLKRLTHAPYADSPR